jgi:hypothetical protein
MDLQEFLKERDAALLSLDPDQILAFAKKYGTSFPAPDHPAFWPAVHKARSACVNLPKAERRKSVKWLTQRGYSHFADDLTQQKKAAGE